MLNPGVRSLGFFVVVVMMQNPDATGSRERCRIARQQAKKRFPPPGETGL
jgi:hypothetical protein